MRKHKCTLLLLCVSLFITFNSKFGSAFHLVESYFRNLSLCVITDKKISFIGVRNSFKIMQNNCYFINEK